MTEPASLGDPAIETTSGAKGAIGRKARLGVLTLAGRQVIIQAINFIFLIVLARLLTPADYGIYALVTAATVALSAAGDLGLSAALLQRSQSPSRVQLSQAFTLQMLVVAPLALVTIAVVFIASTSFDVIQLERAAMICVACAGFGYFVIRSSFAVQFEAKLEYGWMSRVEIAETLAFQIVATVGASFGLGPWSFIVAYHARGLTGVLLLALRAGLKPRLVRDFTGTRSLLRFGIRYQLGWVGEVLGSLAFPVAIAPTVGASGLGLYMNAYSNASRLNVLAGLVARVSLPGLARILERSSADFADAVRRSLLLISCPGLVWVAYILSNGSAFVTVLFGQQWLDSVPILLVLVALAIAIPVSSFSAAALAASGRAGTRAAVMWGRLCFIFPALFLGGYFGELIGVAIAGVILEVLTSIVTLSLVGRPVLLNYLVDLGRLIPAGGAGWLVGVLIDKSPLPPLAAVVISGVAVSAVVLVGAALLHPTVRREIQPLVLRATGAVRSSKWWRMGNDSKADGLRS